MIFFSPEVGEDENMFFLLVEVMCVGFCFLGFFLQILIPALFLVKSEAETNEFVTGCFSGSSQQFHLILFLPE